jgi:hypothetical protein
LALFAARAVVGPFRADFGGGGREAEFAPVVGRLLPRLGVLVPYLWRQGDVLSAEVDGFFWSESGVVEDGEEGDQPWAAGPCARTASKSRRAWKWLMTERRSTSEDVLSAFHLTALMGFSVRRPSSIAYSQALWRIARFRRTVEGAAGFPSRRVAGGVEDGAGRKLAAWALVRNGSFHVFGPVFQRAR